MTITGEPNLTQDEWDLLNVMGLAHPWNTYADGIDRLQPDLTRTTLRKTVEDLYNATFYSGELQPDWNVCHSSLLQPSPSFQRDDNNMSQVMDYQCTEYDDFGTELLNYTDFLVDQGLRLPSWGHRRDVLPPNATILFFGNSHMRQVALSLLCQAELQEIRTLKTIDTPMGGCLVARYRLANNATVYLAANSQSVTVPHWATSLSQQLQVDEHTFWSQALDVLVYGVHNMPSSKQAPSLQEIAEIFSGPILFLPMMATGQERHRNQSEAALKDMKVLESRGRAEAVVQYWNARQYILGMGRECGAPNRFDKPNIGCTDRFDKRFGEVIHRCTGENGGHPDLLAWDVTEFVWTLLQPPRKFHT